MKNAQDFLIDYLMSTGDSQETIEKKSGVSRSTVHRLLKGQTVSTASLRLVADAYGKLDDFLALVSASANPQRAADELHERFEHAERLLTESYEDRIRSLNGTVRAQQEEIQQIRAQHEKTMERIDAIHDKERTAAEQHFERERAALEKALQQADAELMKARSANLRSFVVICAEGTLLLLALLALLLR